MLKSLVRHRGSREARRLLSAALGRGVVALLVAAAVFVRSPTATAQTPPQIACPTPTIFVGQNDPTQLKGLAYGEGLATFTNIGAPFAGIGGITQYNAIGFDTADRLLYGVANMPTPTAGFHLIQIGEDGSTNDLGAITGITGNQQLNAGAFFNGDFYAMSVNSADVIHTLYRINLSTRVATTIALHGDSFDAPDFAQVGNYLWGYQGAGTVAPASMDTFQRLDPSTGTVTVFPNNGLIDEAGGGAGAAWTFGNGNLGLSQNAAGTVSQIAIGDPGSANPTFTLVSQSAGPASSLNDGSSCVPEVSDTDLGITKTGPVAVHPGASISWTLTVTNRGPANSSGFSVTDVVPPSVTNVATDDPRCTVSDYSPADGTTVTCVGAALSVAPTRHHRRRPRDEVPSSTDIVLTGTAPMTDGECAVNSASVKANENDPNQLNNTSEAVQTCVGAVADLSIRKRVSPSPATPGRDVTYMLLVHNHGPDAADHVVVSDPLPAGLSFVSASPDCGVANGVVTCHRASLAANASARFRVVARLASSATEGVVNTAHVGSETLDSDPSNNDATTSAPVGPKSDLALSKASFPGTVAPGGEVSYTLVATNHGPSDAHQVTVSDPLPAGLTLVSAIPDQGHCTGGGDVLCHLGTLPAGGSAQILVTTRVSHSFTGSIDNVAVVAGGNPDPDLSNNTARDAVIVPAPGTAPPPTAPVPETPAVPPPPPGVQQDSDVRIVKTVNRGTAHPGQRLTYTLRVTNHGSGAAADVVVTDTASRPLKILSAVPTRGTCELVPYPVRCSLATLSPGQTASIRIIAQVRHAGVLRNTASATSASRDPHLANNIDSARVTVTSRHPPHRPQPPPPAVTG